MTGFVSSPFFVAGGGEVLTLGETDALGIDFTDFEPFGNASLQMRVKDTVTGANAGTFDPYSKLTYTSPSIKLCRQSDGIWRYGNHNLGVRSQEFDNAAWTKGASSVTANSTTAPDGTSTADTVTPSATLGQHFVERGGGTILTVASRFQWSVYAKPNGYSWIVIDAWDTGSNRIARVWYDVTNGVVGSSPVADSTSITAVGNGWYRCVLTVTVVNAGNSEFMDISVSNADNVLSFSANGTSGVYLWGAELKRFPVNESFGGPSGATGYLVTTSAAVYGLPYEWDASGVPQGILIEEQRTNLVLRSDDFTNASWTKSNMTTAYTSTGPDGVANSASRLTASAANATALQAITSASAARISSLFVKRITGSGNIDVTQDNGTTWTTVTVTNSWTRVFIAAQTLANPTVGIRIVTNADAVDVFRFQHEVGSFATSPIHTIGATVTRALDDLSLAASTFPSNDTAYTVVSKFDKQNSVTSGTYDYFWVLYNGASGSAGGFIDFGENPTMDLYNNAGTLQIGSGNGLDIGSYTVGATSKIACAFAANDCAGCINGGSVATDVSATMPTGITTLYFYSSGGATGHHLQQLTYLKRRATNTELQARTS